MSFSTVGEGTFVWFVGEVVNNSDDPDKAGRVQIKIINEHFDKISDDKLPWAIIMMPPTSSSYRGKGWSPTGIEVGSHVIGFYMDGKEKNIPVVMGTFHLPRPNGSAADHDVNAFARGEAGTSSQYPFNKVYQSLSGHVIEIDDTPANEKIHVYHKSGTHVLIEEDGTITTKSESDNVEITIGQKFMIVQGDISIQSTGQTNIVSTGKTSVTSSTAINIQAPIIGLNA